MRFAYLPAAALCIACICPAGLDPRDLDKSVRPQDDFYQYANGGWIRNNPVPADHSSWGEFDIIEGRNEAILLGIAKRAAAASSPAFIEKLVGDFYFSGMDEAAVDRAGISPLLPELDRIDSIRSPAEIAAEVARLHLLGVGVCFGFGSEQDPGNSQKVIAGEAQDGLGLPDRDYYLRNDDASKKLRDGYVAHMARMMQLAGDSGARAIADAGAAMRLETMLAKASRAQADLRDPVANYHLTNLAEIDKLTPHFDWRAYFAGIGLEAPASVDIGQPEFLQALDAQLSSTPLPGWRAYFRWHLIHDNARYLSAPFVDENFAFFSKELTGTPQIRDRAKRVLSVLDENVGDALGQLYVAEAFPPESKARMLRLVANVRQALRDRLQTLEWMDEATRTAALGKLDAFGVKVGYPDKWIDYGKLAIDRGPYVLNVLRASEFAFRRDLAKIGKPVDRTEWGMSPSTVNAYYNPSMNEIVFAAGILQPPFFDAKADEAVNYGGIGSVIGHEMTHGFDDEGRQFDARGNLSDWWSPESARRFKERANGIVKQFAAYVAVDNLHVNGELTEGENIADLGGLKLSYRAFMKTISGTPRVSVDGFTPEQRFFLSFASIWRTNQRPQDMRLQVNTDPHSPASFRVNGPLSNLDEFASAFGVPEGAKMRRPAGERVTIW